MFTAVLPKIRTRSKQALLYYSTIFPTSHSKDRSQSFCTAAGIPFSPAKHGTFYQQKPKLDNPFLTDAPLRNFLNLHVPKEVRQEIVQDLYCFGSKIVHEIDDLGRQCELHLPHLRTQNAWGQQVDELTTCSAWKQQHKISAEEGLVGIAYERKLDYWSRLHQICKVYLYCPSAGLFTCPLAMTDGAAKTIEAIGEKNPRFNEAFSYLTTRDFSKFWTSGQWMTEKKGGSDVASGTETVAIPEKDFHRLYGYKWFTSAADSNMALTFATEQNSVSFPEDRKKGLTLFYVETRRDDGSFNGMHLVRLKDKLGTRQLATAELLLNGTVAYKMSPEGQGISNMSHMLNMTRIHNSIAAVASMRRILMLARDYSQNRVAFGKTIAKIPLHMLILHRMEVEARGAFHLLMKIAILLGKMELGLATTDEILLLRILIPICKLYTAKQAVSVVSEGLEAFGGQGYMEDTGLPVMLRDSQVLPIWEGTTNVISIDVMRSLSKSKLEVLYALKKSVTVCTETAKQNSDLAESCSRVEMSINYTLYFLENHPELLDVAARDMSYSIARSYIGALLIENASLTRKSTDLIIAQQWCELQDLCPLSCNYQLTGYAKILPAAVMEGYKATS